MKQNYLKTNYAHRPQNSVYDTKLVTHLLDHIPERPRSGKVLDLACGTGGFASVFRGLGFEYTGVDIDNHAPESQIFRANIGSDTLPFADNSFEIIFFKMAIEHLNLVEIGHCLKEVKRVLKPGGAVLILTPDWQWMYQIFYMEFTHQTPFMPSSMRTAIEMSGLHCETSQSLIQLPITWKWPQLRIICGVAYLLYPWLHRYKCIRYSKERVVFGLGIKTA